MRPSPKQINPSHMCTELTNLVYRNVAPLNIWIKILCLFILSFALNEFSSCALWKLCFWLNIKKINTTVCNFFELRQHVVNYVHTTSYIESWKIVFPLQSNVVVFLHYLKIFVSGHIFIKLTNVFKNQVAPIRFSSVVFSFFVVINIFYTFILNCSYVFEHILFLKTTTQN